MAFMGLRWCISRTADLLLSSVSQCGEQSGLSPQPGLQGRIPTLCPTSQAPTQLSQSHAPKLTCCSQPSPSALFQIFMMTFLPILRKILVIHSCYIDKLKFSIRVPPSLLMYMIKSLDYQSYSQKSKILILKSLKNEK